jgi:hypothetical protein
MIKVNGYWRGGGGVISLEVNWLEHETDHVPPSSTDVNVLRYISIPVCMALYEIKLIFQTG